MINLFYTCLRFDGQAGTAADFYCAVFINSNLLSVSQPAGIFKLNGNRFLGLHGVPRFPINESVSFVASCETLEAIDSIGKNFPLARKKA